MKRGRDFVDGIVHAVQDPAGALESVVKKAAVSATGYGISGLKRGYNWVSGSGRASQRRRLSGSRPSDYNRGYSSAPMRSSRRGGWKYGYKSRFWFRGRPWARRSNYRRRYPRRRYFY